MANKFFVWIDKIINGTTPNSETPIPNNTSQEEVSDNIVPETPQVEEPLPDKKIKSSLPIISGNSAIDKQRKLDTIINAQIKRDYSGVNVDMSHLTLVLTITDDILYPIIDNDSYISQLAQSICNEVGCQFESIKVRNTLPENSQFTEIAYNVYYGVEPAESHIQQTKLCRARITAIQGSLKTPEVIIDSEEINNNSGKRYNIGSMSQPYPMRTNHIAIDETDDSQIEYNKYVSREHAHISYDEKHGFLLYADAGGVRENGMRTHIKREENTMEVESTIVPKRLNDKDIIVLSRHVYLLFEII